DCRLCATLLEAARQTVATSIKDDEPQALSLSWLVCLTRLKGMASSSTSPSRCHAVPTKKSLMPFTSMPCVPRVIDDENIAQEKNARKRSTTASGASSAR